MKSTLKSSSVILSIFILVIFSGCMQYPEGPFFTLQTRDERIDGTWLVTAASDASGADLTSEYLSYTLSVRASRSGDSYWAIFISGNLYSEGGYQFASHGDQLIVIYTLFENQQGYSQIFYDIRKLTDKEFIFVDPAGNELTLKKY